VFDRIVALVWLWFMYKQRGIGPVAFSHLIPLRSNDTTRSDAKRMKS